MAQTTFLDGLLRLLQVALVLYPPYFEPAADIFISLKIVAILAGVASAVAVYMRSEKLKDVLWVWPFFANIVLLIICAIGYNEMFYGIDSPTALQKLVLYVLYSYINWNIGFLVALIVFLAPLQKIKEWISLWQGGGEGKKE